MSGQTVRTVFAAWRGLLAGKAELERKMRRFSTVIFRRGLMRTLYAWRTYVRAKKKRNLVIRRIGARIAKGVLVRVVAAWRCCQGCSPAYAGCLGFIDYRSLAHSDHRSAT